ncbi:hypothetical protein PYW08_004469 [Mythimna loreyi]|uniref:Uncharacterized protein n=1 Tax=Mythimna loreyi TaxID=667449 RepID=A0ACC2QNY6_9NEOP|nr:hypothetical protein PYW08_004469 [Mythimna loreyi]
MRNNTLSECYKVLAVRTQTSVQNGRRSYSSPAQEPKPFKSIPGLSSLPIIGPVHHFLPIIGSIGPDLNAFEVMEKLHKKYGPIMKMEGIFARANMVFLFEPELFEQVFRAQEANPLRPGFQSLEYFREKTQKGTIDGLTGLTTAQGEKWREFRTKVNPALLKLKLVKVYAPGLDEVAQDAVNRLKRLKDDKAYLEKNFNLEMTRWSLESVALVALGSRIGCLDDDFTEDHPGRKLMQCAKDMLDTAVELELFSSIWKYFATPTFKKMMNTYQMQWDISTKYIESARKRINERGYAIPDEEQSIVERLLAIDERVAVLMANEMLSAGIDTVSFSATSLMYYLAKNQDKQDKLREEIRSDNPHKRYLRACLKESLRLRAVVPSNLRRTDRDHIVGGYHIPKGVDVVAPNEYLSRLEKYYPQAHDFVPERWLADKSDPLYYGNAPQIITLPFGFGIRSCIGRRIAELEIETFMKRLIDEFKVTWEGPPIKLVNKIMSGYVPPYNFRFENAK